MTQPVAQRDRYALVTGGGRGLGRVLCRVFAKTGYRVAVVGIHRDNLEQTLRMIKGEGGAGRVEICDVTDVSAWHALRDRLRADWSQLDLLANNAGMFSSSFVGRQDLTEVERLLRLNLYGTIYGCETM